MKISPNWIRGFVSPAACDRDVAEALTVSGIAIEGYFGEGADQTWEAEITTNRVDAMNHYGVAREVSAIYNLDLASITPKVVESGPANFSIVIDDAEGCARYTARIVRGVKIAPSPVNIAHRLELIEQRSINNVADASNYVLNEIGQPTHAFDLDKLEGGKIIVRRARAGETLITLDGVERTLSPEDLVIADAVKPVALAGVMGGEATMITDATRNVLIESAWFDPASIRRTSRRLGMHTDASHRYERGADPGITQTACARVAELIAASAGGAVSAEIDVVARSLPQPHIMLASSEVKRILGVEIPSAEIARILRRLGFIVEGSGVERSPEFKITVPTWRLDVEREIDLIEEVARIYSYLKIPDTLPSFAGGVVELPNARQQAELRGRLLALGYNESLSSTFIPQEDARFFANGSQDGYAAKDAAPAAGAVEPVRIANPLSEEASFMRTSLVPGLLSQVAYNLNRGNADVRLFEAGHVYAMQGEAVDEYNSLVFVGSGAARDPGVHGKPEPLNFFHVKGDLEQLLAAFALDADATCATCEVTFDRNLPGWLHPGRAARAQVEGKTLAIFGQLHPEVAAARKLKQDVFVAEVFVEALYQLALRQPTYTPISKYPAVERDFSFVLPEGVEFESIRHKLSALAIAELTTVLPAETFRGGSLAAGTYSFLVRVRFQSAERTLRDDEVANWSQQIVRAVESLGGSLRQ
jgi:phenylalanyl-tRNA synthetase beta chain